MTNRGVRASRDVLVGWTNITRDLTNRAERSDQQVREERRRSCCSLLPWLK